MTRFAATVLALSLATAAGTAAAQDARYGDAPYGTYTYGTQAVPPSRHDGGNAHYDWAPVVRVDPVIVQGRGDPVRDTQRCERRRDSYAANDPYRRDDDRDDRDDRYDDRYDPYADDRDRDVRRDENGRMVATVLGGIAGAVLGSRIGDGSGQYIGTAVGSMVGGMAGRGIYDANRRERMREGYVTVCEPEPYDGGDGQYTGERTVSEYDVTYEYGGRRYTTRTGYHPGDRIRVRVDVRAE